MRMRRVAALAAVTAGLLTALGAPAAMAAGPINSGGLVACNHRAQPIDVEFPRRGGFSTFIINPGTCLSTSLDNGQANEEAVAYAYYDGGHWLAVDHFFFDSRSWYPHDVY